MQRYRTAWLAIAALMIAVLAAACGGGGSNTDASAGGGGSEASSSTPAEGGSSAAGANEATQGESVKFRVTDLYSLEHSIGKNGIQPFMKDIEDQTNGRISFDYFPSNQLVDAHDAPDALRSGTADIANVLYLGSENPLMYVAQLPGMFSDDQVVPASEALWEFMQKNELVQAKFKDLDLRPLFCFTVTNYQMEWPQKGIDSIDKFSGKQVRAAGAVLPFSVQALGASPVNVDINEAFDAFNRGVIDGIALSVPSTKAYAFYDIIKSAVINANMGGFPVCYAMSQSKWDSLSDADQQLLQQEADKTVTNVATALGKEVSEDLQAWKDKGIETYEIDEQQRDKALSGVEGQWLDKLVSGGIDRDKAQAAVDQWKSLLQQHIGG